MLSGQFTQFQLVTIKNEITLDPTGLGYAGKNDIEKADILNTIGTQSASREIKLKPILEYIAAYGIWPKLKQAQATNGAAEIFMDLVLSKNMEAIDLLQPVYNGMLDSLVDDFILTLIQKADLQNMCKIFLTRAEEVLSVHPIKIHHLDVARSLGRG